MSRDVRTLLNLYNPNNPLDHASTIPSPWYFDARIAELYCRAAELSQRAAGRSNRDGQASRHGLIVIALQVS